MKFPRYKLVTEKSESNLGQYGSTYTIMRISVVGETWTILAEVYNYNLARKLMKLFKNGVI